MKREPPSVGAMLLDRVRALMEEGRHGTPGAFLRAEDVARHAVAVSPESGSAAAALFNAEAAAQLDRAAYLRALRSEKFLETLHQVELSHVPFPDEPPVVWPSAEVWQALTERRKKWASVSLESTSPAEERIRAALIDPGAKLSRGVQVVPGRGFAEYLPVRVVTQDGRERRYELDSVRLRRVTRSYLDALK